MKNLVILITLFICFKPADLTSQNVKNRVNEKLPEIEKFIQDEIKARKIPGLVFGIFGDDSMLATKTYGLADVQNQVPVKTETIFELASITKQFTASAILILQQDGKLKVSDKLCKYLEECPEQWSEITIHQLLTHTSGLPGTRTENGSLNILKEYSGVQKMHPQRVALEINNWSKQFHFDLIKTDSLENIPGTVFDYSNVGYQLLGIVIDNIAGSYRNLLEERIFKVAGMNDTYIQDLEKVHHHEARGYTLRNGELVNTRNLYQLEITGSYGVFSNITDLQKWDEALNTEEILTIESKKLLWDNHLVNKKHQFSNSENLGYGYGWAILNAGDKNIVWHNGSSGTEYLKAVDDKISIVVLTNLGEGNYDQVKTRGLTGKIASILSLSISDL